MVKRNLRKQKRKDYEKINNGVDGDLQNGEELSVTEKSRADGEQNNNNNTNSLVEHNGGENGVDAEVLLDVDSDHEELEEAEKRLNILKKEKKKLLEKEKREYIARETKQVEKELKKLREKEKKHSDEKKDKEVTIGSLRGMRDVVGEVDKLMDKKFSLKTTTTVSSDSEKSYASSSSVESDSTGSDLEKIKESEESPRKKKSGGYRRSGKNRSSSSYVKYPQRWPHTQLALHFACTKEKKLEELSIPEFCAGYITILETSSKDKMEHRRAHLKELMYLATKYQWKNVLSYHAACLTEIERGHLRWGDSFQMLQNTTLAGAVLSAPNMYKGGSYGMGARSSSGQNATEGGTVFCNFYQRGTCSQTADHMGFFKGERRLLKHICAKCWLINRKVELHSEMSADCPSK